MKQTVRWIVGITLIVGMPFVAYCGEFERQSAQAGTFEVSAAQSLRTFGNEMHSSSLRNLGQMEPAQTSIRLDPQVSPETVAKLQSAFQTLREEGFPGIQWQRLPLGVRYVRVPLQLVTCPGCVSYAALIPVGALTPTSPVGDPNKASYFILERSGEWIKPESRYSTAIPMPAKDIFAQCADIDALAVRAWTLPEAVQHAQSCLDKTYNQHPFSRRIYFVTAQADRFGVRACPEDAPVACQAIMLVEGIKITVSGRRTIGDPVIEDIGYALQKRGRMLLGFHAILEDKTEVWH